MKSMNRKTTKSLIVVVILLVLSVGLLQTHQRQQWGFLRTRQFSEAKDHAVVLNEHNKKSMDLWWMSNLRDTPLQLTKTTTPANDDTAASGAQFIFPPETKKVWVDVGVNKGTDFRPQLEQDPSLFVLGFEPSHLWKPCSYVPHCAVFWAACTPDFDVVHLNVQSGGDLCDSLLTPNTNTTTKLWKGCVTQKTNHITGKPETVQVPGIPLRELVGRIPDDIIVEYIKIDAQGYDLEVMKGAFGAPADKIQVVSLEGMDVTDRSKLLYMGQPFFSEIKQVMSQNGWHFVKAVSNEGADGELNGFFVSNQQYASKVERLANVLMGNKENGRRLLR